MNRSVVRVAIEATTIRLKDRDAGFGVATTRSRRIADLKGRRPVCNHGLPARRMAFE